MSDQKSNDMSAGKLTKLVKDGWANILKGFGGKQDTTNSNTYSGLRVLTDTELASMYAGDGWQKKIATIPAGSMTREWISIPEDAENDISKKLKKLDTQNLFKMALVWQRTFRGGLIWMVSTRDPKAAYKDSEKIDIKKLLVFSASEVRIESMYGTTTVMEPGKGISSERIDPLKIGEAEYFRILPNRKRAKEIIVHASQCLVFRGDPIPSVPEGVFDSLFMSGEVPEIEYLYWGTGVLQSIFTQMSNYGIFENGMGKIGSELVVGIYKIAGLREILQSEDGIAMLKTRIAAVDAAKSMINALFLDAEGNEAFDRNTVNLAGVPELWDKFMMVVSGVSNIPASKLFGRQASGLNNKGEQDERNYNDYIVEEQGKDMRKNLEILLWHLEGKQVTFTFHNPWAPSQAELVTMRKDQSEIDDRYYNMGVLTPEEIRKSRFADGYSFETALLVEDLPEDQEGDEDLPEMEE